MRRITDIEELKKIQLDILLEVHSFCINKGIRYSLDSGTLIGAIRHKGYIPWDDDIDIIMPRPDYNQFLKEFNGSVSHLEVYAPELDWNYYAPYANVCDKRTILSEGLNGHRGKEMGIKIDIFPVDGTSLEYKEYERSLKRIDKLNAYLYVKRTSFKESNMNSLRAVMYIIKMRLFSLFRTYSSIQKQIAKISTEFDFNESEYAAKLSYTWTKNRCKRTVFENYMNSEFEGHQLMILKGYDEYLRKMYGDYMQLPPEDQRVAHHGFVAYWK